MKNYITLLACCLLTTISIGQEVSTKQYSFMAKKTADWCPRCGDWGWTYYKSLYDNNSDKAYIPMALHFSGGLMNNTASALAANYGGSSQPLFWLNNEEIIVLAHTVPANVTSTQEKINDNNKNSADIGIGIDAWYEDNSIEIKVKAQALKNLDQLDYYLGVYFVKNHLIAPQASQPSNADHLNVLDRKATPDHFGVRLEGKLSNEDDEFVYESTLNNIVPHTNLVSDMKIVAIMWQKDAAGQYQFVNGNIVDVVQQLSATSEESKLSLDFDLIPNTGTIDLQFKTRIDGEVSAFLYDVEGKLLSSKVDKKSNQLYSINIDRVKTGIYFVQVGVNNKVKTKQVFIAN